MADDRCLVVASPVLGWMDGWMGGWMVDGCLVLEPAIFVVFVSAFDVGIGHPRGGGSVLGPDVSWIQAHASERSIR